MIVHIHSYIILVLLLIIITSPSSLILSAYLTNITAVDNIKIANPSEKIIHADSLSPHLSVHSNLLLIPDISSFQDNIARMEFPLRKGKETKSHHFLTIYTAS